MAIFQTLFKKRKAKPEAQSAVPKKENAFAFRAYAVSDVGRLRENNEDNYFLGASQWNETAANHSEAAADVKSCSWQLAGVFDGMGGGEAGELASAAAAKAVKNAWEQMTGALSRQEVDVLLRRAFLDANNTVVDLQRQLQIFGTTGTLLCTDGNAFKIYHNGDSRAYLIREGDMFPLTKDQTLAQMKLEMGMYDENDPNAEAEKHKLVEYIGRDRTKQNFKPVESHWIPIEKGDGLLLCSDGLYDMVNNEDILFLLLSAGTPREKAALLADRANTNGGIDNITCIYISFN